MSAAMPARCDFYYFVPTFLRLEFGSCVQKKGTTTMQKKCNFLRALTAIAIDAACNFRAASRRTGVARLNIFRTCCWIANLHKNDASKPNHVAFTKYFP